MIGIDLGTTNSLVCVWEDGQVRLLKNRFGNNLTPSVVSFDTDGNIYVGDTAKERLVTHPEVTFREFKRNMGTNLTYTAYGRSYTPEELSALVLKQLKQDAEYELGHPVDEAVISVPAYFDDKQRNATRNAGLLAGLKVERLINEPSAAALSYHLAHYDEDEMFIVFDFGGGTLDVSLVDAFENVIEIQAISGNNKLGGKDFNSMIAYDICVKNSLDPDSISDQERAILLREAEKIKIALTDEQKASAQFRLNGTELTYELDNQGLIDISSELFAKIEKVLEKLMNDANASLDDISRVIMVGGSSKMPIVRQFVSRLFEGRISESGNPDEIVCCGTGLLCGIRTRTAEVRDIVLYDICPFTLGTGVLGDVMSPIIAKNQVLPCSRMKTYTTASDKQTVVKLPIYQGENRTASKNLPLAKFEIQVPPRPEGEVKVEVRFSYDINGLFDIDIQCKEAAVSLHRELGAADGLSEDELAERRAALEKIKIHPREVEQFKILLEKADALYLECNEDQQAFLAQAIRRFTQILDKQDLIAAEKASRMFQVQLAMVEASKFRFHTFDREKWNQTFEEDEYEDETEDEEDF